MIRHFINHKVISFMLFVVVLCTACNDFEELNTDPTRLTDVDAASVFTQVVFDTGMRSRSYGNIGNYIGQYWTNTSLIDQRHRYDFRGSDSEAVYDVIYGIRNDIADLKQRANEEGLDDYLGAALVLDTYLMTYLTDVFGPVPFTESVAGDQLNFTPAFDQQEIIYRQNLDSLDKAYELLATQPGGNFIRGGDPFYFGDNLKWRKFANSLKLRMLMKMVNVDQSAKGEISHLIEQGELIASVDENAAIIYDGRFGLESANSTGTAGSVALGATFADLMHETLDPRRSHMARLGTDANGDVINVDEDRNPIYLGVPSGEEPDIIRNFNGLAAPYTGLNGLTAPSLILSHAEIEFYMAEAILKGYAPGNQDDARAHYEAGIRSSCEWWGVDDDEIGAHLTKENVQLSDNVDEALEQIYREEYINFYYQGYDGWLNYRRVGAPAFNIGSAMLADDIMQRMVYPPLLKEVNGENYDQAVQMLDRGDDLLSKGWWSN
ncbi:SusD/RagB family nutrient-binding outer membrane lipoprotein [Fulvivirgaceae bacterium BMA10]|uniref:SusD/RagB family nutrient-binding outer membrane lipoprotein n=1 Tax=Splendidivirga corallicola TaxID=3051826 RepID=A0ABT8KS66_9BACT|nr:SusD/RagB family nutrient-binding outer membrane lipoprotein [Fulvivirgaceae bacterium BMA10]